MAGLGIGDERQCERDEHGAQHNTVRRRLAIEVTALIRLGPVGEVWLKRYEVQRPLGSGGMADVFLARDVVLDRRVVLKRLKPDYVEKREYVGMFLDEARTVARIEH